MGFQVKVGEILGDSAVLHVEGEIDIGTVNHLLDEIGKTSQKNVFLDFSQVTFIDSTGIGLLVRQIMEFRGEGRNLELKYLPETIKEILDEMGMFEILSEIKEGNAR